MTDLVPYPFTAPLTVCVDFKNPHAYLAKDLLVELQGELGLQVDWLPYLTPPLAAPSEPRSGDDRGVRHRHRRARYVEGDIQRYAKVRGLIIRDVHRQVDSTLAAMALMWASREPDSIRRRVIDRLFAGHWEATLDIADFTAVTAALAGVGVDLTGWQAYCSDQGRGELLVLRDRLAAAGIFNVPAMVVTTPDASLEIFYGRAHLPMVRWLLQGRVGAPPI
jgi:2-hydroxychromene-2-carboxylate isomerase